MWKFRAKLHDPVMDHVHDSSEKYHANKDKKKNSGGGMQGSRLAKRFEHCRLRVYSLLLKSEERSCMIQSFKKCYLAAMPY